VFTYAGPGYWHTWSADGRRCGVLLPDAAMQFYVFERPGHRNLTGNPGAALRNGKFSPDNRWLLTRDDRHLCLWDLRSQAPPALLDVPMATTAFFSPDSNELFAVPEGLAQPAYLGRWRLVPGSNANQAPQAEPLATQLPSGFARAVLAGNELVMTGTDGVSIVPLSNGLSTASRTVNIPAGLAFTSPDGRWLAMIYEWSPVLRIYRLPQVEEVARLETSNFVSSVTFSPDGDELLVLNRGGVEWFDTATWRRTRHRPGANVSGSYAFYTPDGTMIWMVTHFRNAALFDRRTLEPLLRLPHDVLPLALSPDGRQLAVSVEGQRVQLWDVNAFRGELAKLGLDW